MTCKKLVLKDTPAGPVSKLVTPVSELVAPHHPANSQNFLVNDDHSQFSEVSHLLFYEISIPRKYFMTSLSKNFDKMKFLVYDWNCRKYAPLISRISKRLEYFHGKESREFNPPNIW